MHYIKINIINMKYEMSIFYKVYQTDPRNETSEKREVIAIFKHPLYNDTSLVADLCLLKVCEKSNLFTNLFPYIHIFV